MVKTLSIYNKDAREKMQVTYKEKPKITADLEVEIKPEKPGAMHSAS